MIQTVSPRAWWSLAALLVLFTLGRVATTHRVFSQTVDEPWHLVTGYDVLTKWRFTADLHHPPLARVFFALPFLTTPEPPAGTTEQRGNALLVTNDRYTQNVARARFGNLLFVALGIVAVALWARHLLSPAAGLLAALLFASLPPILAHGGLATTDMAVTALLPLALYTFTLFLERPTWGRTFLLGVVVACGLLSKYSFLAYFPPAALALLIVRRRVPSPRLAVAAGVALLFVWGVYGFALGTIRDSDGRGPAYAQEIFGSPLLAEIPLPAPLYWMGAMEVKHHDDEGHRAFLFGEMRENGWWYYFPVALFYKTPIPFLILGLTGCALLLARRRSIEIAIIAPVILAVAMTSHLNIGIRHVLPIYGPLAIGAAFAITELRRLRIATALLIAWAVVGGAAAHPDYLPWFNGFAGQHPERILNDSNLDWGQDALRLARYARRQEIAPLSVSLSGMTPLDKIGLPPFTLLEAWKPLHGWVAVSEFNLVLGRAYSPSLRTWIDEWFAEGKPFIRIGKTIRLYHFD
jgi:4-amino-4-deoxy-L-arabinose transferase-like glycosyltransferase